MTAALVFLYKYQREKLYKVRIFAAILHISLKKKVNYGIINMK